MTEYQEQEERMYGGEDPTEVEIIALVRGLTLQQKRDVLKAIQALVLGGRPDWRVGEWRALRCRDD